MPQKNVLVYSYDVGPVINIYNPLCARKDHAMEFNTVFDRHLDEAEAEKLLTANRMLVMTPSSFETATDTLLLSLAAKKGLPTVIIADTHGALNLNQLKGAVSHAYGIVASKIDIPIAQKMHYKSIQYLGGPPRWASWYDMQPVLPKEKGITVFLSSVKQPDISDHVLESVVRSLKKLGWTFRLIFSNHPREKTDGYDLSHRKEILASITTFPQGDYSVEEIIASSDLVISTGGSTTGITAAHMRKRAVSFSSKVMVAHNKKQGIGIKGFLPVQEGAIWHATTINLTKVIHELFTPSGYDKLVANQKRLYTKEEGTNPVDNIIDFLKTI